MPFDGVSVGYHTRKGRRRTGYVKGLYFCAIYDHTKPVGAQVFPRIHSGSVAGYPVPR